MWKVTNDGAEGDDDSDGNGDSITNDGAEGDDDSDGKGD